MWGKSVGLSVGIDHVHLDLCEGMLVICKKHCGQDELRVCQVLRACKIQIFMFYICSVCLLKSQHMQ